ncbi:MAG: sulfotransferase domain-containing protein, partial [Actinomycetota bacterium]
MSVPDFLIVGAQKAGTSSLYAYLRQHPGLFLSARKEPHFFCSPGDGRPPPWTGDADAQVMQVMTFDPDRYAALFADAGGRPCGEASTMYLVDPDVPARVVAANPDVRVVVLLRDPVERAYAAWWMWRRDRLEPLEFATALEAETARTASGWGPNFAYRGGGLYAEHLQRWRHVLGPDRMLVLRTEALRTDRLATVQSVFTFLGVDAGFAPDVRREHNRGSGPRPHGPPRGRHPLRSARVRAR